MVRPPWPLLAAGLGVLPAGPVAAQAVAAPPSAASVTIYRDTNIATGDLGALDPSQGLALITDHDAGTEGLDGVPPVTQEQVFAMFDANLVLVRQIITTALAATPLDRTCACADAGGGKVPTPPGAK